ncbi:SDR family NAD(P)-dependent oxidoreductase [Flaviaesturariibacter amylovorans]|uniref:SDR family oxidoreductase n=1 Tax=Flaviaesturariibacter amylovorans TaxID=1084520 RepID=A0ABP8HPG5_9BACT
MQLPATERARLLRGYGPWALVTGASSGIGRELATQLAVAGLHLVLCARSGAALEAFSEELRARYRIEVAVLAVDLGTDEGPEAVVAATRDRDIGLLVCAAGFGTSGRFTDTALSDELDLLRLNCLALLHLTHHFSRRFAAQRRGGIILLSSIVAFQGVPYAANYAASKAYVQSLAEALAVELRPAGVAVLAAAPGPVRSGFGERAHMQMGAALLPNEVAVPILQALGRRTTVLPGFLSKLLTWALRTVPRAGKVRIMAMVMGGMTRHQRS